MDTKTAPLNDTLPWVLRALYPLVTELLRATTPQEAGDAAVAALRELTGASIAAVYVVEGPETLRLVSVHGLTEKERLEAEATAWKRHPGMVVRTLTEHFEPEVTDRPGEHSLAYTDRLAVRSRLFVPLRQGDKAMGALGVASTTPFALDERSVEIIRFLALLLSSTLTRREKVSQLASAVSRLGNVIDHTHVGILLEDETRRVLHSNQTFCNMFGIPVPPAMLVGADCEAALQQSKGLFEDPDGFVNRVHRILDDRRTVKRERLQLRDGRTFDLDFVPIFNGKKFEGILWNYDDVTEKLRQEREVEAAARLIEEEHLKAQNSARLASLGEMAGGIAHEINTPLAIISTLAGQLAEISADPSQRPDFELIGRHSRTIEETAHRIATIIQSLRRLSRDASKDSFIRVPVRQIAEDAFNLCGEAFKNRGVALDFSCPSPSPEVDGRPAELAQVLINLLTNAQDAVKNSPIREVTLACRIESDRKKVILEVSDSGPGIDAKIRQRLFEPFFTTKAVGEGTGLGLGISRRILEGHGGQLEFDPNCERTTFRITLPLAPSGKA